MKTVRGILDELVTEVTYCEEDEHHLTDTEIEEKFTQAILALREVVVLEKRKLTPSQNFNLDYGWNSYRAKVKGKFK